MRLFVYFGPSSFGDIGGNGNQEPIVLVLRGRPKGGSDIEAGFFQGSYYAFPVLNIGFYQNRFKHENTPWSGSATCRLEISRLPLSTLLVSAIGRPTFDHVIPVYLQFRISRASGVKLFLKLRHFD